MNFIEILEQLHNLDKMPLSILGESFKLYEVPFGTDLKNKQWKNVKDPISSSPTMMTFFHLTGSGKQYIILLDENSNIKFNIVDDFSQVDKMFSDPESLFKLLKYERSQGNITMILGAILSVLKRSKSVINISKVFFVGNDQKLQNTYEFFANNIAMQKYLRHIGVEVKVHNNHLECNF